MLAEATAAISSAPSGVLAALHRAASETGADFGYLLDTAMRESGLKPQAKSNTSSATGLFQFIDQTWLGLVKQYGAKFGLSSYAAAIRQGPDGRCHADNPADRQAILALRNDPQVSALMEGEFANQTRSALEQDLGRDVCNGELYAAHFLGPSAACKLIRMSEADPSANAAAAFPQAAGANRSVFYRRDGSPKTVREVHDWALKQTSVTARAIKPATPAARSTAPVIQPASDPRITHWSSADLYSTMTSLPPAASQSFVLTPGIVSILASLTPDIDRAKRS
jgi:Transglycosylase SLT domain